MHMLPNIPRKKTNHVFFSFWWFSCCCFGC